MDFDLENPLTNFPDLNSDDSLSLFFVESDHMPTENYPNSLQARNLDVSVRREAIASIAQLSCNFDPFISYLAVNYLDRFLSNQEIPQLKPWVLKLLSVSCVSLAAKMKKTEFSLSDFAGVGGLVFDAQTIERMEYMILGALKWRMRSITPFSFISFFLSLFKLKDPPLMEALKAQAIEIIFKVQMDVKLLDFKPSVVAASALLSACHELFPLQFHYFKKVISNCSYVNKENMVQCCNAMQNIEKGGYESGLETVSSSNTPVNVLDQHFSSSSETDKTNANAAAVRSEADLKRRKINEYRGNQTVHISQI